MNTNTEYGFTPTHPGEVIKDELEYRGISQKRISEALKVPYTAFNEILNGKRTLSAEISLRLEAALGIDADLLISMQYRYNMQTARKAAQTDGHLKQFKEIGLSFA